MTYDLVLRGGRVFDPSQAVDRVADVAFAGGLVAEIGDGLQGSQVRDVAGLAVSEIVRVVKPDLDGPRDPRVFA